MSLLRPRFMTEIRTKKIGKQLNKGIGQQELVTNISSIRIYQVHTVSAQFLLVICS